MDEFSRTELLLGNNAMQKLAKSHVAIFGVGGVGGYVAEALARCGIGTIDLIDKDVISSSNINRQIIALHSTIGRSKVDVMKERILDISPDTKVNAYKCFYLPENASDFDFGDYSYVVDAVDTVTAKLEIIARAKALQVPVISCMGAGNKLNPSAFTVDDIYNTSVCPLARVMRHELKKRGINSLKVVYSKETPIKASVNEEDRRSTPGSIAFVPSSAGLLIASEVIMDLCKNHLNNT